MMFMLSITLVILLFFLNEKPKVLFIITLGIVGAINFILDIPKESKESWMYDITALLSIIFIYTFFLLGVNITMKVLLFFNPNGLKYENIIRKIYLAFCMFFAFFAAYVFFIKGVIYD